MCSQKKSSKNEHQNTFMITYFSKTREIRQYPPKYPLPPQQPVAHFIFQKNTHENLNVECKTVIQNHWKNQIVSV